MEQHEHCKAYGSSLRPPRDDNPEFNLRDWDLEASRISRQTTNFRRFSASHITGLKEDACRSFWSNITFSSTASSPRYPLEEEIDPSTYSFTTALKALQAKSIIHNNWDCLSPEGFVLNSKWNDAEKYICNPHSGQVPVECLSARSFRNSQKSPITMSGPLVYFARTASAQLKPPPAARKSLFQIPIEGKKVVGMTKDVGIRSTEADTNDSSSDSSPSPSPSPTSTPSIGERMSKRLGTEAGESSPNSSSKPKSEEEVEVEKGGEEEANDEEALSKRDRINGASDKKGSLHDGDREEDEGEDKKEEEEKEERIYRRSRQASGCLSWMRSRKMQSRRLLRRQKIKNPFFVSCASARRTS